MVSTSLLAAEDHGCTLQQWQADDQFILNGGAITQMFMPCQCGILEYVAFGAQSASTASFGARLKVYEMDNGIQTLIHQQQGFIPGSKDACSTVFSLSRNIPVNAEREYFLEVDIPEGRAMSFQYSGLDVYDEGELTVNHARLRGDLAFEVGVNPREIYDLETRTASPVLRTLSTGDTAPEHAYSVAQPKYNGIEMLAEGAWSQTFSSCYTGDLESIWFQGEILQAETGVKVTLHEDLEGNVTVGVFTVLGQMIEEHNFNGPTAGTEVVFLTPNDNDQEFYAVRIVNEHALLVDSVYRR